ncbi:MAG: 16S rRNA (guanine(527)-N(7))-methyltransferase RsmG [Chloroflexi bacterium]|nr:16S rRNA (guanine(527)-N(7))-methyltransferase RsmG [Chloroflexota bacterium]
MVLKWVEQAQSLFGVVLNEAQVAQFADYEAMLMDWNARFNLTAIRDLEGMRLKHFLDSLSCVMAFPSDLDEPNIIDVGTGAGFPGVPLKIVYPKSFLTLVESIKKKAGFCGELTRVLGLRRVLISSERAETLGQDWEHREFYDIALARAVAGMPTLVEYLLPLVKVGGRAIIQKGASAKDEADAARNAIRLFGGKLHEIIPVELPGVDGERFLVLIEKIKPTPGEFPRAVGVPSKSPILN